MTQIAFRELPLLARVAAAATYFMVWVMFAEFVIDRHGLDAHLPFYRVGNLCPYDLFVIATIIFVWVRMHRS